MGSKITYKDGDWINGYLFIKETTKTNSPRTIIIKCCCDNEFEIKLKTLKTRETLSCTCKSTHGDSTPKSEYFRLNKIFRLMKDRCYNQKSDNYQRYGGRGITVCDIWRNDYQTFKEWSIKNGYNQTLTIDRNENDNGRWTNQTTQILNRGLGQNNKSGYSGVCTVKPKKDGIPRWQVSITINYKSISLGYVSSIEEGVNVRNNYILTNNLEHKIQKYIQK